MKMAQPSPPTLFKSCLTGRLYLPLPGQIHIQYEFPIGKMRFCSYRQKNKNWYLYINQTWVRRIQHQLKDRGKL